MNSVWQAIILGILQGFTEFLPISSSAHLILLQKCMGWQDFGLGFDIAMHVGSLFAIISYFSCNQKFRAEIKSEHWYKLVTLIGIATIPVGIVGLLLNRYISVHARSITVIAASTILFGFGLGYSYYCHLQNKANPNIKLLELPQLSVKSAIILGLVQALAIIPGGSRSGLTLTAGLLLGFNLMAASKISFIMAIPVILAAGAKQALAFILVAVGLVPIVIIVGFISSMLSSLLFVWIFFRFINKIGIWPFVIYRMLLGVALISS